MLLLQEHSHVQSTCITNIILSLLLTLLFAHLSYYQFVDGAGKQFEFKLFIICSESFE